MKSPRILFFDGACHLCQRTVQFVLKHESAEILKFASLQSEYARQSIPQNLLPPHSDSLVLWEKGIFYAKSRAVLRLCGYFRFPWSMGYGLRWFPQCLGDPLYDFIARRRYRWFGKTEACALLHQSEKSMERLIDDSTDYGSEVK